MKLDQKGAVDFIFIIALVAIAAVGYFVFLRVSYTADVVNDSAVSSEAGSSNSGGAESEATEPEAVFNEIEEIGLKHVLPEGWTSSRAIDSEAKPEPSTVYSVSNPSNDLSIEVVLYTFQGGFEGCNPVNGILPSDDSYQQSKIYVAESTANSEHTLIGYEYSSGSIDFSELKLVNSDYPNFYETIPQTEEAHGSSRIEASALIAGNSYYGCTGAPLFGLGLVTPIEIDSKTRINVVSKTDTLAQQLATNSDDLKAVNEIMKTFQFTN